MNGRLLAPHLCPGVLAHLLTCLPACLPAYLPACTEPFRSMLVVEPYARPLLQYMCTQCGDALRGDKLLLCQVSEAG